MVCYTPRPSCNCDVGRFESSTTDFIISGLCVNSLSPQVGRDILSRAVRLTDGCLTVIDECLLHESPRLCWGIRKTGRQDGNHFSTTITPFPLQILFTKNKRGMLESRNKSVRLTKHQNAHVCMCVFLSLVNSCQAKLRSYSRFC